jgi:hypothetical protein
VVDIHHHVRLLCGAWSGGGETVMATSLKAYAPVLARRLGTTAAALYERQRTLVRAGLLEHSEGRGPGSGVQLGPYPVALLLLAISATDSLSDTAEKVRIFATAKSLSATHRCPLTGAPNFGEAVARILDPSQRYSQKVISLTVGRTNGAGLIKYTHHGERVSQFIANWPVSAELQVTTKLEVEATINNDLITAIVADLQRDSAPEAEGRRSSTR